MTWCQHEADTFHVAGRGRRQRDRRLRSRGRHADPDLPDLRAAHDAGAEPEDGGGVHSGEPRTVLRSAATVRSDPGEEWRVIARLYGLNYEEPKPLIKEQADAE